MPSIETVETRHGHYGDEHDGDGDGHDGGGDGDGDGHVGSHFTPRSLRY